MDLPTDEKPASESLKVTDKRLFTSDGEIREEYRDSVKPADPNATPPPRAPEQPAAETGATQEKKRKIRDAAENPDTPFTHLVNWIAMSVAEIVSSHRQRPTEQALQVAKQLIDWISVLKEKTEGNLSEEESAYLDFVLHELMLRFVDAKGSL